MTISVWYSIKWPGPSCSKLTMSLVNDSLKFWVIRKYAEIFCWKNVSSFCSAKATHISSAKNIRILYIESAKTVNEMTLNELVKLTTLWTTGPKLSPPQLYIGWHPKMPVNPFNWLNSISLFLKVNPYTCEMYEWSAVSHLFYSF